MTRHAGTSPEETREAILRSAAVEFGKLGYEKASIRQICSNAGVTTGALYFFFADKEDLFESVIAPVTSRVLDMISEHYNAELSHGIAEIFSDGSEDFLFAEKIIGYYYDNRDIFDMLLANRSHPAVVEFLDSVTDKIDNQTKEFIALSDGSFGGSKKLDDFTIHWISHLQLGAVMHIFTHNMEKEQAEKALKTMMNFLRGGFYGLIAGKN